MPALPCISACTDQKRAAVAGVLLSSSALSAAVLAVLLASPQAALAACDVTGSASIPSAANSISCAADTTTIFNSNLNGLTASSSDRNQTFDGNGNVTATVNNNVTVDGAGLRVETTQAGSTITFTNNGAVTSNEANNDALSLNGNGGLITYSGNGSASNLTTGGSVNGLFVGNTNGNISIDTGTPSRGTLQ